jgi:hypothetical protein
LLFVNIAGNVAGTLLTGFVLIDAFGTAGTYRLLTLTLGVAGVAAASMTARPRRVVAHRGRRRRAGGVVAFPVESPSMGVPERADDDELLLAEDHACAATIKFDRRAGLSVRELLDPKRHPFDDFHV